MDLVYFLHALTTSYAKIGWTSDIVARVNKLRIACPNGVQLLAVRPGPPELERAYHSSFAHRRMHGEWFSFEAEIIQWLSVGLRCNHEQEWKFVVSEFESRCPDHSEILVPFDWDIAQSLFYQEKRRRAPQTEAEVSDE